MKAKITIRDIANLANVSVSTVSRVISNSAGVDPKKITKVHEAIEMTGYQPNYTARALATKSTNTIGVIIDTTPKLSLSNSYFIEVLEAIASELSVNDKDMLLIFANDFSNSDEYSKIRRLINSKKIDAIIKLSVLNDDKTLELLSHSSIPTVVIGNPKNDVILSVDNNNVLAMQTVVKELINAGKTKIAFIGGNMNFTVTDERLKGYKNALLDFGIAISYENIYYTDFSISSGFELAHSLIYKNYDAIVCTDDLIAVGIANKYEQINKKCVITGFNNTYYAQMSKIPICSVDINVHELGKQAVRLLNSAIEANIKEDVLEIRRVIVDTNLIRKEILWQN